ncbi:hypothetical protein GCM10009548_53640 [Streptomyces malaysiensis subsp. malaysiensis]
MRDTYSAVTDVRTEPADHASWNANDMSVERDWLIRVANAFQRSKPAEEAPPGPNIVVTEASRA